MEYCDDNLHFALDTLGALLKEYGRNGFDLPDRSAEELDALTEQWSRHILYATAAPGTRNSEFGGKRDWNGLRGFFTQHRSSEKRYVTEAFSGIQNVVRTFIHEMGRNLHEEQEADLRIHAQMNRLKEAASHGEILALQQEALDAVMLVSQVLQRRRENQRVQMETLHSRIRELEWQLQQAREEGNLDPLTRLYNRKVFDEQMLHALDMRVVFDEPSCLLLIDADHFKFVNDTYGHVAGDTVLRHLANCLALTIPSKADCVARFGGEEFGIILTDSRTQEGWRLAERVLNAIRALRITLQEQTITITASIGVAEVYRSDTASRWLERADNALYMAKQQGRNRVVLAEPPSDQRLAA
jgi:diguanylate cyclase (GGDEF)-like protein